MMVADPEHVSTDLWHTFLAKHIVPLDEQEAFLDMLTEPDAPTIRTLDDLENAYRQFLRRGSPPLDIH
jgi:hypothetical protein